MNQDKKDIFYKLGNGFLIIFVVLVVVSYFRLGVFSTKLGLNLAVVGDGGIGILALRPAEGIIAWSELPPKMKVNISGSSAVYPVESLWSYGELERRVYSVVSKSLSETTGVVISRVLKVSGKPSVDQVLGQLHRLSMQTDLSLRDRLSIRAFMSSGQKKVFEYEVPKSTYDNVVDPDGMTFVNINSGFYSWARNKFPFDPLLLESADVVVDNISGVQGAGNSFAKMIEIAGTRVVEVKSSDFGSISTKNGCYFYSVGKYVLTEKMLIEQCGCKRIQINSSEAQKELPNNFKGIGVWLR